MTIQRLIGIGFLALCALPAAAQEAAGRWNASIETPQGALPLVIELAVEGNKLTGTFSNQFMPKVPLQDGVVEGSKVTFTLMLLSATLAYEGVLDGDKLTLTHKVLEERDTRAGQSLGAVLMSAEVLTATRER